MRESAAGVCARCVKQHRVDGWGWKRFGLVGQIYPWAAVSLAHLDAETMKFMGRDLDGFSELLTAILSLRSGRRELGVHPAAAFDVRTEGTEGVPDAEVVTEGLVCACDDAFADGLTLKCVGI